MGYIKLEFFVNVAIKEVWQFGFQAEKYLDGNLMLSGLRVLLEQ